MKIRRATDQDWPALCQIYHEVRQQQFPWMEAALIALDDLLHDAWDEEVHVACQDNTILGFISLWVPDQFIHHLFIRENCQGKGIGGQLLDHVQSTYPGPLRLKCVQKNQRAFTFYSKRGWRVLETGISPDGAYLLMEQSDPPIPGEVRRKAQGDFPLSPSAGRG